jgi:hypothetical protein
MDQLLDLSGVWLARLFVGYGLVVVMLPVLTFANVGLLALLIWAARARARERPLLPFLRPAVRRWTRLVLELAFGLINPLIYLAVLTPSFDWLQWDAVWFAPLTAAAWVLLAGFWAVRVLGAGVNTRSSAARLAIRGLLSLAAVCLVLYIVKDLAALSVAAPQLQGEALLMLASASMVVRTAPFYLIPLVLLWPYLSAAWRPQAPSGDGRLELLLLPGRAARMVMAGGLLLAVVTTAAAMHRRSEATVRALVGAQRDAIRDAATQYDVDARLIAAIVYVTHRDQLAPFRDELERLVVRSWAEDDGKLLNRPLDLSIGVSQIKPRTAQMATLLASRRTPADLSQQPEIYLYRDAEALNDDWRRTVSARDALATPFPMTTTRDGVVAALLEPRANLATCALILALYQQQWETAHPDFSLRRRPEILATLYQIGFARSKPHGAPRSNAFGRRVREVYDQTWLDEQFPRPRPATPDHESPDDASARQLAVRSPGRGAPGRG